MARIKTKIVCVHRLKSGRPVCFHEGRDRIVPLTNPVVIVVDGEKIEVRESKREIDRLLRDA